MLKLASQAYLSAPETYLRPALEAGVFAETKMPFLGRMPLVIGHPEIQDLLKDTGSFAVDARNAGHTSPFGLRFLPNSLKIMANNILAMDNPDHMRLRRLVDEPFRRVAIDTRKADIRERAEALVTAMTAENEADIVEGLGRELPLLVIFDMLGFSETTRSKLHGVMQRLANTSASLGLLLGLRRLKPAQDVLRREFREVRHAARLGLVSELVHAEAEGDRLSDDELLAMVFVLFAAGHETTTHLISTSVYTLLTHPGAAETYRSLDAQGRGIAVDELMRFCAPVQMTKPRFVRHDMEFHGKSLKRGERLMALLAAGNRDSRVFDSPDELDLTRRPNRHIGWGGGPHICLGLHLARVEAQAALDALFDRFPDLALADPDAAPRWGKRPGIRGLKQLKVRFR